MDLRRVEAGHGMGWKEMGKKIGAGVGQFVENEGATCDLRQDR